MSMPLSEEEKEKLKLIRKKFNKNIDSNLTTEFIDKVIANKIMYGANILDYNEAINFCKEKDLNANIFKAILCYSIKGEPKVSQSTIGNWFNETSALGDKVRYMVTKYYDDIMRSRK